MPQTAYRRSFLRLTIFLAFIVIFLAGFSIRAHAQGQPITPIGSMVNGETATPVPGAGHDYIHLLSETVDPSSGSVNLTIQAPMPKSRGITLPFAFSYSSAGVYHLDSSGDWQPRDCA